MTNILTDTDNLKEFTPIPFWFWNDELDEEEIKRQMTEMKDKGVDGFVIHPRKGLPGTIQYLSERYFHYVKYAVALAGEMDMKVVLYDEAMYPSGSCHGEVVKADPDLASKGLLRTTKSDAQKDKGSGDYKDGELVAETEENGERFAYYLIPSNGTIRGVHENEDDGEANAPKSADLLNPEAVKMFIKLTHERYYSELSEYFGSTIISFFTDEPNILGRNSRPDVIPWSRGIFEEFKALGGKKEDLQYLFTGKDTAGANKSLESPEASKARDIYKKVIHDRMSQSYYRQLSDWCISHNIVLTGHPEKSTDIGYLKYFGVPCQDIVWRFVEPEDGHAIEGEHSTMGKCSSDSARHRGRLRNGNECFGCCGERQDPYLFTESDMRWYLNWLFVRGVNLVYPHAFYYSIRDGRGDERPPEVGLHNPYWPEYHKMSDFIKRMCYLNTDSVNQARVAILCSEDELSWKLAKPLFTHQIEFNYLERELLSDCSVTDIQEGKTKSCLSINAQAYTCIVCDEKLYKSLFAKQRSILDDFVKKGGTLILEDEDLISSLEDNYLSKINNAVDPKVIFEGDTSELRFSHVKKGEKEFFILSNEGLKDISFKMKLKGAGIERIYNPYTGKERLPKPDCLNEMKAGDLWLVFLNA